MAESKTIAVLGIGPALGMSIARRFGREGYRAALVSRSSRRHENYLGSLAADGIAAEAFTGDLLDPVGIAGAMDQVAARFGTPDVVYYGPNGLGTEVTMPDPLLELDVDRISTSMNHVLGGTITVVQQVLAAMLARGYGGFLVAGGMSGKMPMPQLGSLGPVSAAVRMYVLALHEALAPKGIYAGILTIGGLIKGGDIEQEFLANKERYGITDPGFSPPTLDPDDIAETAWQMHNARDRAESAFSPG